MEKIFTVEGMHCSHCSSRVIKALEEMGLGVEVSLEKGEVRVTGENINDADVKNAIEDLGFIVK